MWADFAGSHVNTIYSYSFSTNCWRKKDITLPVALSNCSCVLTNDQQHIIILGGIYDTEAELADHDGTDVIYVWNLKHNTIKQSGIKCPAPWVGSQDLDLEARITPINVKVCVLIVTIQTVLVKSPN
eukprot:613218_1